MPGILILVFLLQVIAQICPLEVLPGATSLGGFFPELLLVPSSFLWLLATAKKGSAPSA